MIIVVLFSLACLSCYIVGIFIGKLFAEQKMKENEQVQLDSEGDNMWIDGKWYSETQIEAYVHSLKNEIEELKKDNEIYRTMADNAMLERKDESDVID